MPINRFVIILLALSFLFAIVFLLRIPASAQQPTGITLTPTESEQTPTPTDSEQTATPTDVVETPTATEPVVTDSPTPTEGITIPPPGDTSTPTPTDELTVPPPGDTSTPTPDRPQDRATRTPPVLPSTGQSPLGGGFPVEGLFAILLLALVGWFFLRGVAGARAQK